MVSDPLLVLDGVLKQEVLRGNMFKYYNSGRYVPFFLALAEGIPPFGGKQMGHPLEEGGPL